MIIRHGEMLLWQDNLSDVLKITEEDSRIAQEALDLPMFSKFKTCKLIQEEDSREETCVGD